MKRVVASLAGLACAFAVLRAQPPARAPQTFRTGAELVFVDVSVRDGGRAVTGLTPDDFEVTDNGVRQQVESVETTAVPIDLTLIVDVSGNPGRPWARRLRISEVTRPIEREISIVRQLLRHTDRLRVFAVDSHVQQALPLTESREAPLASFEFDGLSSLYDTLATALLQPSEPARRHVIVARTKGRDTISSITSEDVRAIAATSDAQLHVVVEETVFANEVALDIFQCNPNLMGICAPTRRGWVPFRDHLFTIGELRRLLPPGLALAAAAEATGGQLHRTELITEPSLTGTFKEAFDDFRSGYMLRYSPRGVAKAAWHAISVKVRGRNNYEVRARNGYGVDEPTPPPAAVPVVAQPRTIPELSLAYSNGAFENIAAGLGKVGDLTALLRTFEEGGNPWPAAPNREAALALEMVEPAVFSGERADRDAAYSLLRRFTSLVRDPLEPGRFERYWHFVVLTMLEGTIRPTATEPFVANALQRFPDEPRFLLSRAIVADQRWAVPGVTSVTDATGTPTAGHVAQVRGRYEAAIAMPEVSAEARIRLAWFLHRLGRHGEALVQLNLVAKAPLPDPSLRYLRQLFLGHVLTALGDQPQAATAFEAARTEIPASQSPKVAMMNLALLRNDRAAAEALAEEIQGSSTPAADPWWSYWQGQYRLHSAALGRLREMAR